MSEKLKVGNKVICVKRAYDDDPYEVDDIGTITLIWDNGDGCEVNFSGHQFPSSVWWEEIKHWCEGYQSPLWKVLNGV